MSSEDERKLGMFGLDSAGSTDCSSDLAYLLYAGISFELSVKIERYLRSIRTLTSLRILGGKDKVSM